MMLVILHDSDIVLVVLEYICEEIRHLRRVVNLSSHR